MSRVRPAAPGVVMLLALVLFAALALVRHFGAIPIGETKGEDVLFFILFGTAVLSYPAAWVMPLALLAAAGTVAVLGYGLRRRRLTVRGLAVALLALGLVALVAGVVATLGWQAILGAHPESQVLQENDFYGSAASLAGLLPWRVA